MPIAIEAVSPEKYLAWIDSMVSPFEYADNTTLASLGTIGKAGIPQPTYIPWMDTLGMKAARAVLNDMYAYSIDSTIPSFSEFLGERIAHLLEPPKGDTGIL